MLIHVLLPLIIYIYIFFNISCTYLLAHHGALSLNFSLAIPVSGSVLLLLTPHVQESLIMRIEDVCSVSDLCLQDPHCDPRFFSTLRFGCLIAGPSLVVLRACMYFLCGEPSWGPLLSFYRFIFHRQSRFGPGQAQDPRQASEFAGRPRHQIDRGVGSSLGA